MVPFNASKHLASMNRWLVRNGHPAVQPSQLSSTGFIIPGVAAGFIAFVDSLPVALMDGLVTNPLCSAATRDAALDAIVTKLLQESGQRSVMAFSEHDNVRTRALKHGFVGTNLQLYVRT